MAASEAVHSSRPRKCGLSPRYGRLTLGDAWFVSACDVLRINAPFRLDLKHEYCTLLCVWERVCLSFSGMDIF